MTSDINKIINREIDRRTDGLNDRLRDAYRIIAILVHRAGDEVLIDEATLVGMKHQPDLSVETGSYVVDAKGNHLVGKIRLRTDPKEW